MDNQDSDMLLAHKKSMYNREQLENSKLCGCFYCLKIYPPSAIDKWVDNATTALCAHCEMDSVIGSASNYPITEDFLKVMHQHWFLDEVKF